MFNLPGVSMMSGNQHSFTVEEFCDISPTDAAIWKSIRAATIQRLTRNFYWKCIHNIFRVGNFWGHIEKLQILETMSGL
jgi:hypothetical protein